LSFPLICEFPILIFPLLHYIAPTLEETLETKPFEWTGY
jgi:hypothetical protein